MLFGESENNGLSLIFTPNFFSTFVQHMMYEYGYLCCDIYMLQINGKICDYTDVTVFNFFFYHNENVFFTLSQNKRNVIYIVPDFRNF